MNWLRLKSRLHQVQNTHSDVNWPHSSTGAEPGLAQPLGTGKAALCACGLWRARTMLLLNSCDLWQLNYRFSADLRISIQCLWQKGCLGKMNKQLWQIPGIQVLAGISKEATVTNRGPQHRTRPLRNRCLSPHRPGLGAGPGTHTSLRTWLPLQEHKWTQTSTNTPKQQARNPAPSDQRDSEYSFSRTTTELVFENIIQQARSHVRNKSGFRDPAWCFSLLTALLHYFIDNKGLSLDNSVCGYPLQESLQHLIYQIPKTWIQL